MATASPSLTSPLDLGFVMKVGEENLSFLRKDHIREELSIALASRFNYVLQCNNLPPLTENHTHCGQNFVLLFNDNEYRVYRSGEKVLTEKWRTELEPPKPAEIYKLVAYKYLPEVLDQSQEDEERKEFERSYQKKLNFKMKPDVQKKFWKKQIEKGTLYYWDGGRTPKKLGKINFQLSNFFRAALAWILDKAGKDDAAIGWEDIFTEPDYQEHKPYSEGRAGCELTPNWLRHIRDLMTKCSGQRKQSCAGGSKVEDPKN